MSSNVEHVSFKEEVVELHSSSYVPETPIEVKMAEALKTITCAEGRKTPKLAKIQLQFPKAARAFQRMHDAFHEVDTDKNGTIDLGEITSAFRQLGGTASDEEIEELFDTADTDNNKVLTFKEFVVFLCVCSLVGHMSNTENLDVAFKCAVDAFDCFDVQNAGVIVFSELHQAMDDRGVASPDLLLARMQELDQDGNGYVIFPEFLMAFMDWVGVDEDEEEDDEES